MLERHSVSPFTNSTSEPMTNLRYIQRFVKDLYQVDDFPELDSYGTDIFGREIKHSWKIFRHIAAWAQEGNFWKWDNMNEVAYYGSRHVSRYSIFTTIMAHECAHGWCFFHSKTDRSRQYSGKTGEEEIAWDVSKLVCEKINVPFATKVADMAYEISELDRKKQTKQADILAVKLPLYLMPPDGF